MLAVGCSKDNPDNPVNPVKPDVPVTPSKPALRLQNSKAVLFKDSEEKIIVEGTSVAVTFRSLNPFIATVSSDGVVKGHVRGETNISVRAGSDSVLFHVSVETRINTLIEPNLEFGKSMAYIKSKIPKEAESVKEVKDAILFWHKVNGVRCLYLYMFDNGRLTSSTLSVPVVEWEKMSLVDFLYERYVGLGKVEDAFAFVSPDLKTAVFAEQDKTLKSYISIMYTPRKQNQASIKHQYESARDMLQAHAPMRAAY